MLFFCTSVPLRRYQMASWQNRPKQTCAVSKWFFALKNNWEITSSQGLRQPFWFFRAHLFQDVPPCFSDTLSRENNSETRVGYYIYTTYETPPLFPGGGGGGGQPRLGLCQWMITRSAAGDYCPAPGRESNWHCHIRRRRVKPRYFARCISQ